MSLSNTISLKSNSVWISCWCDTDEMDLNGADILSREFLRFYRGIKVLHISRQTFHEFITFFTTGTRNYYESLIRSAVGSDFSPQLTKLTASFAT